MKLGTSINQTGGEFEKKAEPYKPKHKTLQRQFQKLFT